MDKKKIAAIIVGGLKPKLGAAPSDTGESDPSDSSGGESDEETAAKEVMDALKSDDVKGFAEALSSFVKICGYSKDEGE